MMNCTNTSLTISSFLEALAEVCKTDFVVFKGIYLFWIGHEDRKNFEEK